MLESELLNVNQNQKIKFVKVCIFKMVITVAFKQYIQQANVVDYFSFQFSNF